MSEEKTQVQNARKDLDILNKMKNLPGGLVIIPLVIAVVLATFVPQVFQIGGYVTALFYEGNACMMGFFLIVCGSMIDIKQVGMPLYKGVIMTGTKFLLGVIVGLIVGKICGPEGFLGIAQLQTQTDHCTFPFLHSSEMQQIQELSQSCH